MKRPPRDPHEPVFPYDAIRVSGPLTPGAHVDLGRRGAEQLGVRQVGIGEGCTLLDADGAAFRARLTGWSPRGATATVTDPLPRPPESPLLLTLFCAFLARQRMLWVCQKATELGAVRIVPVYTAASLGPEALEHEKAHAWAGQAVRAARQARRAVLTQVCPPVPLQEALAGELWTTAEARLYMDDRADPAPREGAARRVCLALGPEGGWSDEERQLLAGAGALPLVLGGRVLRAETALLVGATVLQYEWGDFGPCAT